MALPSRLARFQDLALLLVRLSLAATFILHGYAKWGIWSAVPEGMPAGMVPVMKILSIAEPLGGVALLVGFLTLPAAIGIAIIMIGAIVMKLTTLNVQFTAPGGWELDLALLFECVVLMVFGPGKWSVDAMRNKK